MVIPSPTKPLGRSRQAKPDNRLLWLNIITIFLWGVVMMQYWLTGKLRLLVHPAFSWLCILAGFFFLLISIWKALQLRSRRRVPEAPQQHISLFPPGWSTGLLLASACVALVFTPRPFASQVALERGVTDFLSMTRIEPESFRGANNPEDRSIVDWTRTLSVYPEPDAYAGQPVDVKGFVVHPPNLDDNLMIVARFMITCCAADAYPVGLPVELPAGTSRNEFEPDSWLRIRGEMKSDRIEDRRQVVILAETLEPVPEPADPYGY
ncbi:MAG: TIGR03943 family protein [Phormidium sp. BM_Day4_Bin.17]|nr:TIGR03943 family protein [Phormidium sp. BM_Day4_Bin.17]UCJ11599.1 MAG: TIGR03943 family protein [Phormidium sp. PBR-2020]